MKTNIQKYPAYKDSGAEWLGDLPIHWESIKMKHLFQDVSIKKKAGINIRIEIPYVIGSGFTRDKDNKIPGERNIIS